MLPLTVYGSETCEDTALARDHLRALGIPFQSLDRETDPRVQPIIERVNGGRMVTPTIVFGNDEIVLAEPALAQLEEALRAAGYRFQPKQAVELRELSGRPAPDFTLQSAAGTAFELGSLRGRRKAVLFFAHAHDCRICQGYARQLARHVNEFEERETRPIIVLPDQADTTAEWAREFAGGLTVLADPGGQVKRRYADYLSTDADAVWLLVLDAFTAPRVGSFAADAGGLIIPNEALEWVGLLEAECPE